MNNSLKLNFNGNIIKEDFVLPLPPDPTRTHMWKIDPSTVIHSDLLRYFEETIKIKLLDRFPALEYDIKNSFLNFIQLFHTPSNASRIIHVDGTSRWGLNYVLPRDSNSYMNWYKLLSTTEKEPKKTVTGGKYFTYTPEEVELLENQKIEELCLVNTSIPHSVDNLDSRPRYAFSFRSSTIGSSILFDQIYQSLKEN